MYKLLELPYSIVDKIRKICIDMIDEWKNTLRDTIKDEVSLQLWKEILYWDRRQKLLKAFENYNHKWGGNVFVDKNLFLYDLAVVAIMKNEAPYVKEWLDYHLLAGVDHFFIYDNETPDNLKEVF